jgi:hypothetical protein
MKAWSNRSPELAALFNPAFCSLLVYTGVAHYQKQDKSGMPLPLAFLLLPVVLSSNLRETLPSTARTPFQLWLDREPQVKIQLAKRATNLAPITREALLFLVQRKRLALSGDRLLKVKVIKGVTTLHSYAPELPPLVESVRILGNMFGKTNDAETVFASLGLSL